MLSLFLFLLPRRRGADSSIVLAASGAIVTTTSGPVVETTGTPGGGGTAVLATFLTVTVSVAFLMYTDRRSSVVEKDSSSLQLEVVDWFLHIQTPPF